MHAVLPLLGERENWTHVDRRDAQPQRAPTHVDQRYWGGLWRTGGRRRWRGCGRGARRVSGRADHSVPGGPRVGSRRRRGHAVVCRALLRLIPSSVEGEYDRGNDERQAPCKEVHRHLAVGALLLDEVTADCAAASSDDRTDAVGPPGLHVGDTLYDGDEFGAEQPTSDDALAVGGYVVGERTPLGPNERCGANESGSGESAQPKRARRGCEECHL